MSLDLLERLRTEGDLLVHAVRDAELDRRVPGLDWDARTVALHTGAVHRWAADIVRRPLATNETGGSVAFRPDGLTDADLPGWLGEGLVELMAVLADAPDDLSSYTFVPGVPARTFWRRRQAHETAIHRADVEAAGAGGVTPFPAAFAQDGLAELVGAFATETKFASQRSGSLLLVADDGPAWHVTFGGERHVVTSGSVADLAVADATVRASSSELYLWAWNRPAAVEVSGDPVAVETWRQVRIR